MLKKILALFLFLFCFQWKTMAFAQSDAAFSSTQDSGILITVDQFSDAISQDDIKKFSKTNSILILDKQYRSEIENTSNCFATKNLCPIISAETASNNSRLITTTTSDFEKIRAYIEDISRKTNRDPLDAKFSMQDGKVAVFADSQNGIQVNIEKSTAALTKAINEYARDQKVSLSLPYETIKPKLEYADINNLGINSLIGEGVSDFKGSTKNRIHNIKTAMERFNGRLIKPGEEFSFVSILGDVDAQHGYLPELVIKKDKTEPDFGGGICQVSTTMFRAAIYSGLEITARRNHAYPVSYYNPQGMDSTVYVPKPDLKFRNNTPGNILIQVKTEGTKLIFDFYGTDDGRSVTIDGPTITEKQPDGAMKTSFTQHVFDKDGKEFISDVFNSKYESPYKFPHPGGPVLSAKPSNWSNEEWKSYQQMLKDIAKANT